MTNPLQQRNELEAQITKLLAAIGGLQAQLGADANAITPAEFQSAMSELDRVSRDTRALMQQQHHDREKAARQRVKPTLSSSLLAGAEASEHRALKLKLEGRLSEANEAMANARELRAMAAEEGVKERRSAIRLVTTPSPLPGSVEPNR